MVVDGDAYLGARLQEPCEAAPQTGVHVYHFPFSSCSQMVRFALCAKNVTGWESHVMDIFNTMNHLVRLKLYRGSEQTRHRLALSNLISSSLADSVNFYLRIFIPTLRVSVLLNLLCAWKEPDYVRINPRCVVPSLVIDGKVLGSSSKHAQVRFVEWEAIT